MKTPSKKAGASKGLGRADAIEYHGHDTAPSRCVCQLPATSYVHAPMLDNSVVFVIGCCPAHEPKNETDSMALVRALLHGIAGLGRNRAETRARKVRR